MDPLQEAGRLVEAFHPSRDGTSSNYAFVVAATTPARTSCWPVTLSSCECWSSSHPYLLQSALSVRSTAFFL